MDRSQKTSGVISPIDIERVIASLTPIGNRGRGREGIRYEMRIIPYRTLDNMIDGAMVTFGDITHYKTMEKRLTDSQSEVDSNRLVLAVLGMVKDKLVDTFCGILDLTRKKSEVSCSTISPTGVRDIPSVRRFFANRCGSGKRHQKFHLNHGFGVLGIDGFLLDARRLIDGENREKILLLVEDNVDGE